MPLKTPTEYIESLRDGRNLYVKGEKVEDLTRDDWWRVAVQNAADDYRYDDPETRDVRTYTTEDGTLAHRVYCVPRSVEDLHKRIAMTEVSSITVGITSVLMALYNIEGDVRRVNPMYADNIVRMYKYCRDNDLRAAEVITDAKGDRGRRPADQDDPDLYMRIVERRKDGIVVRGAKLHITSAALVHELVVMPTKSMSPGEEDYSVSFSIPVNTPGITIINRGYAEPNRSEFDYPISARRNSPEGFVVFDDVFVPWERVFLAGETQLAGVLANSLGLWERIGGLIAMVHRSQLLVGIVRLMSEYNGISGASHVQDKLGDLIFYAEILRMALDTSIRNYQTTETGMVYPDPMPINVGKYYGASNYNMMVRHVHDISGGSIVTMPLEADLLNEDTGRYLRKYLHTRNDVEVEDRMRLFNLVRDLTADSFGGWENVTTVQAGGGLAAQRIVALRSYDLESAKQAARDAAGIRVPVRSN